MCILRRWVGRGAAALALALALSLVPAAAFATDGTVHCGQVLTKDTVLNNDLTNCPGDGLIIGADGVTVDLNGHEISGTEAGNAGSAGIRNRGHDDVVIKNTGLAHPYIHGFQSGILLRGVEHNRVIGLLVDGRVDDLQTSTSTGIGIALYNSHENVLKRNNASGGVSNQCGAVKGAGIALFNSDHNDIQKNLGQLSDFGIALVGSQRNVLEENQAAPENSDGNNCFGIYVADSNRNAVRDNIADNNHEGIFVPAGSRHTRIVGNLVEFNGDDGIDVNSVASTITRNTANTNGDLGIEAVSGVTDGGGNSANNNGDPRQCVNVECN
jgi:parallel beta-helix repeat protein